MPNKSRKSASDAPAPVSNTGAASLGALQEALIAKDALAHVTAHDLRTPLNTLTGLVHLIEVQFGPDQSEKARKYIDYMQRAVQQMDDLIDTFLDQTNRTAAPIAPQPLDMRRAIDRAIDSLPAPEYLVPIDVSGPSWTVLGDPDLLHLLLVHVLRNARQHPHPERPLAVKVDITTPHQLRITDTGTGFDAEVQQAIFLPVAGDGDTGKHGRFGLSICTEICRRHGWHIGAQSDGQNGAAFHIRFV